MDQIYTGIVSSTVIDIYIYEIHSISFDDYYSLFYELLNTIIQASIC